MPYHCQNIQCREGCDREYSGGSVAEKEHCPYCGFELKTIPVGSTEFPALIARDLKLGKLVDNLLDKLLMECGLDNA